MLKDKENNEPQGKEEELNIFEEFNSNEGLKKEIEELKEEKQRDFFFYAIHTSSFLKVINLLLFLFFSVIYVYFYLQDKEDLSDSKILNPVCNLFLWDISSWESSCSSVTYAINKEQVRNDDLKKSQFGRIINIIPNVYSSTNWFEWEEIAFLLSKTKNRLRPMDIIEEFDKLINSFESDDKRKVTCNSININSDFVFTAKCEALSRWYENKIVWYDWSKSEKMLVSWTSVSIAASFLNFLRKKSEWKFTVIEPQKKFTSESKIKQWYTKRTSFNLRLQYNTDNLLLKK